MKKIPTGSKPGKPLRARAEKLLAAKEPGLKKMPLVDVQKLMHELRVHQMELEMKNEELRQAYQQIEEARARYLDLYDFAPVGYFILDSQGLILEVNLSGARILGKERGRVIQTPFFQLVAPEDRPVFHTHLQEVLRAGGQQACELRLTPRKGAPLYVALESTAVRDEQGKIRECRTVVTDISKHRQAEAALRASESRFTELFDAMSSGVAVYEAKDHGRDFIFKDFNRAAARIEQVGKKEVLGRSVLEVFPDVQHFGLFEVFQRVWRTGTPEHHPVAHYQDQRISGWRDNYVYKLPTGEIIAVYDDVTARKQAEMALQESEERLRLALRSSNTGLWDWDLTTNQVYYSPEWKGQLGYEDHELPNRYEEWESRLHPEDRDRILAAVQAAHEHPGSDYEVEFRLRHQDGTYRWINARGTTLVDAAGQSGRMLGAHIDITRRKILERENQYLASFTQLNPNPVLEVDVDGAITFHNAAARNTLKKLGLQDLRTFLPSDLVEILSAAKERGERQFYRAVDVGNAIFGMNIHFAPPFQAARLYAVDITDRKQAEEALRESEATVQSVLRAAPIGIGLVIERIFVWTNEQISQMTGYAPEELRGQGARMLYPSEEEYQRVGRVKYAAIAEKGIGSIETRWQRQDGAIIEVLLSSTPIDPADLSGGIVFTAMDITPRKKAEEELRVSETRFRDIADNALEWIWEVDAAGKYVYSSSIVEKLLGYKPEEVLNRHFFDFFHPDDRDELKQAAFAGFAAKQGFREFINRNIHKNGNVIWLSTSAAPIIDDQGKLLGYRGADIDITEGKQAEQELKLKEKLLDSASDSIFLHDLEGHFIYLNEAAYKDRGYTKEELLARNIWVLPTPEYAGVREELLQELLAKGEIIFESAHFRKDGSILPVEIHARTIDLEDQKLILSVARDITERQDAAMSFLSAAQKWRTTFDAIGDAVSLLDGDCTILQCNRAMADLVGKPFSEIIGHSCWEVMHGTVAPIDGCPMVRMQQSRRRETLTLPMGDRWLHVMTDPILNAAGEVTGAVHIIADITAFKLAEEKIKGLNTLLHAIKNINEALIRVKSEPELFQQTCDLLMAVPYVRFTWIGLVQPDSFEVQPVAWAGVEEGYLAAVKITWDDSPYGRGPSGVAIKTGKPAVVGDIDTDPLYQPWRQEAQQRGYASSLAMPLVHEGTTLGIINVFSGTKDAFGQEELDFLIQVAGDIAVGVKSLRLEQGLAQSLRQMQAMMGDTVEAIAAMAEMRDPYTAGHQRGVTHLACALAREMGLPEDRLEGIRVAGFLHDIGKITVPAEILNKPGKLNEFEMSIIKNHSQIGHDILQKIAFPWPVAQIVLQHHERLNGSGYPQGLTGPDILLEARILAVADVVEAMAAHRPYRPALGLDRSLEEISRNRGVLYDPEVVDTCLKLFTDQGYTLT